MPESTITNSELHDPKSPYFDPTLSPDAMSGLHIRQYPGDIGASDIDRRDSESNDEACWELASVINFDPVSPAQVLASAAHVAGVMTEQEVIRCLGRTYDLDYMDAAERILAATITGNARLGVGRQVVAAPVTLDLDGLRPYGHRDAYLPALDGRDEEHFPQIAAIRASRSGIFSRLRLGQSGSGDLYPLIGWQTTTTYEVKDRVTRKPTGEVKASMFRDLSSGQSVDWWGIIKVFRSADDAEQAMTTYRQAVYQLAREKRTAREAEHGPDPYQPVGEPIIF